MPHNITALILRGKYDKEIAQTYDLHGKDIGFDLTLFHVDHHYSAYWQFKLGLNGSLRKTNDCVRFPTEIALAELMKKVSGDAYVEFAIIFTDYFGGVGDQYASVYIGEKLASESITKINQALAHLGVKWGKGVDEFETVGLDNIRSQPDALDKYYALCEEHDL